MQSILTLSPSFGFGFAIGAWVHLLPVLDHILQERTPRTRIKTVLTLFDLYHGSQPLGFPGWQPWSQNSTDNPLQHSANLNSDSMYHTDNHQPCHPHHVHIVATANRPVEMGCGRPNEHSQRQRVSCLDPS